MLFPFVKRLIYTLMGVMILSLVGCAPSNAEVAKENSATFTSGESNVWRALYSMPGTDSQLIEGVENRLEVQNSLQTIDYGNCTFLYAVQPGDTFTEIARITGTTQNFVQTQNDLDDEDDLIPGIVLCLETGDNGLIPITGERSSVEVTGVSTGQTVSVRGMDFPSGESISVFIFRRGVGNPNIGRLGSITVPEDGTFERTFQIPATLRSYRNLIIRFRNPDENVSASTTFINANVDRITPDECAEYYTVRSGDILSLIALDVNVSVESLVEINNLIDANLVLPGQMLCTQVE